MADLLLKRRPSTDPNSNPSPPSNLNHGAYPSLQSHRLKPRVRPQRPKPPGGFHTPFKKEDEDDEAEEVRKAAHLLLSKAWAALALDLCECCSASLNSRLVSMASLSSSPSSSPSLSEAPFVAKSNRNHFLRTPVVASETEDSLMSCVIPTAGDDVDTVSNVQPDMDSGKQQNSEMMISQHEDNVAADLVMKMALNSIENSCQASTWRKAEKADAIWKVEAVTKSSPAEITSANSADSARMQRVIRKKDYCLMERIQGANINVLEGLELHKGVFDDVEQQELIKFIYHLQELGRNKKLHRRTYSEPRKWMRGKGRVTIQFGCCYNYAVDKDGNPPGILRDEEVDEMPEQLRMVIKRLVRWHVLPSSCVPDSCIVNIYEEGDCIPPHIDHHDFLRPFCTLSLLSECNIVFGSNLKIVGPGDFQGSISIPLPTGSVFILNGNGADVAKHAVPAVPTKRISITFRKMDPKKVPHCFRPDPGLFSTVEQKTVRRKKFVNESDRTRRVFGGPKRLTDADFPALGTPTPK